MEKVECQEKDNVSAWVTRRAGSPPMIHSGLLIPQSVLIFLWGLFPSLLSQPGN